MKKKLLILSGVFTISLIIYLIYQFALPILIIPASVNDKYNEVKKYYSTSVGTKLRYCQVQSSKVYHILGSGGFDGVEYYFDQSGLEMGSSKWTDMGMPEPHVIDLHEYSCVNLRISGTLAKQEWSLWSN